MYITNILGNVSSKQMGFEPAIVLVCWYKLKFGWFSYYKLYHMPQIA